MTRKRGGKKKQGEQGEGVPTESAKAISSQPIEEHIQQGVVPQQPSGPPPAHKQAGPPQLTPLPQPQQQALPPQQAAPPLQTLAWPPQQQAAAPQSSNVSADVETKSKNRSKKRGKKQTLPQQTEDEAQPQKALPQQAAPPPQAFARPPLQQALPPQQVAPPPQAFAWLPPQQQALPPQQVAPPPQAFARPPPQQQALPPQQVAPPPQAFARPPPQQQALPPQQVAPPPQAFARPPPQQQALPPQQAVRPPQALARPPQQAQTTSAAVQPGLTTAMKGISLSKNQFAVPRRTNALGTKQGKTIRVETNYLAMSIGKCMTAVHYDVEIQPDKPKAMMSSVVNEYIRVNFPGRHPAFDGSKNMYSSKPLPAPMQSGIHSATVEIKEEGRKETTKFEIVVKQVAIVDISSLLRYMETGTSLESPRTALQCLDVVFRNSAIQQLVKVGRSFFSKPSRDIVDLGDGLELWYGHFQSAVLGWKPFINIDVAHKGFPKDQSVLDVIKDLTGNQYRLPLDTYAMDTLRKFLKNLKVTFELPGQSGFTRTYRVNDVCETPKKLEFRLENGQITNVYDYFLNERNYRIQNPDLPCLWVGNLQRKICYPAELCKVVPGQVIARRYTEKQTSTMIRKTATSTDERRKKIFDAIHKTNLNASPAVRDFGVTVANEFEKVSAQVLDAPQLMLDVPARPRDGVWNPSGFKAPVSITKWMIINLDKYVKLQDLEYTADQLIQAGRKLKLNMAKPEKIIANVQLKDLQSIFTDAKRNGVELVVTIVSPFGNNYAMVKQNAELRCGVLTQCIKSSTLKKMNYSTATNLLLKINTKLTGTNQSLGQYPAALNKRFMVMGADVTHPPPDQRNIPSIAAVTASHDRFAFKYNLTLRLQPPREEVIVQLAEMAKEQLTYFHSVNKFYPEVLMMFRDGVSEGQFEMVLNYELVQLRKACESVDKLCRPAITIMIVQKRHHTRLFPEARDAIGKHKNVPVGTMVDKIITHPTELDFYLVSHASIQGMARPTRYHCIWNDGKLCDEELQLITYYLCHLFARCARSVSYPAPTYYAHLACMRARVLTEGKLIDINNLAAEQVKLKIMDDIVKKKPMFFV